MPRKTILTLIVCLLLVSACEPAPAVEETPGFLATETLPTRASALTPSSGPASPTPSRAPATRAPASPTPTPAPVCTPPPCTADETYACGNPAGCPGGCGTICVKKSPTPAGPGTTPETGGPSSDPIAHLAAGQPVTVTAIHMLDTAAGWAVAAGGVGDPDDHILRTADGGATWQDVTPPERHDPSLPLGKGATAFFLDANTAWATFYDRTVGPEVAAPAVWRTADAGKTWALSGALDVSDVELYLPSDVVFVDAQTGWLMAHVGAGMMHDYVNIYATADGGQTWERVVDPFTDNLPQSCGKTAMVFADARTGWVTGDCQGVQPGAPYLQKTTDGGRVWQFVELPPPASAPEAFKTDTIACGTYSPAPLSPASLVVGVVCNDFNVGQFFSFVYATSDGGQTWASYPVSDRLDGLVFVSPQAGWVMTAPTSAAETRDLYQTQDGGQTLTKVKTLNWQGQFDFVVEQEGWAVAKAGDAVALVHTTDGGRTWKEIRPQIAP